MKKLTKNQRDYQMRKAVKRIRAQRLKARRYYLTQIKTGQLKLERTRVYNCLANYGPDVDIQRVGRILPKVRKELAKLRNSIRLRITIMNATAAQLYDALCALGYFGPKSDHLRSSADRYY